MNFAKRLTALCLALGCMLMLSAPAKAQEWIGGEGLYAVVCNPNSADRLNLRAEPSRSAASLGKYYNGAYVRVWSVENGWAHVTVGMETGSQTGYMMLEYLNRDPFNIGITSPLPTLAVKKITGTDLMDRMGENAQSLGTMRYGAIVSVLGVCGDWYHVQSGGITGFLKKDVLGDMTYAIEVPINAAYIRNGVAGDQTALCYSRQVDGGWQTTFLVAREAAKGGDRIRYWEAWTRPKGTGESNWHCMGQIPAMAVNDAAAHGAEYEQRIYTQLMLGLPDDQLVLVAVREKTDRDADTWIELFCN